MKTPSLIEVPKTAPSKRDKLKAFKDEHGIWTYRCPGLNRDEEPWVALLITKAREALEEPTMEPFELIANYCRVLDERNLLVTGKTEMEAVRELCRLNRMNCNL